MGPAELEEDEMVKTLPEYNPNDKLLRTPSHNLQVGGGLLWVS